MFNKNKKLFQYLSIPLFIGGMSLLLSWQGALLLFFAVYTHEHGHLYFAKKRGIPVEGIFMIPFIGGAAIVNDDDSSAQATLEGIMGGPLVTFAELLLSLYGYWFTDHHTFFIVSTHIFSGILLFNLSPIARLDGGQLFDMYLVTYKIRFALFIKVLLAFAGALYYRAPILFTLAFLTLLEVFQIYQKRREKFGSRVSKGTLLTYPLRDNKKLPKSTVRIAVAVHALVLLFTAWVFHSFSSDKSSTELVARFFGI